MAADHSGPEKSWTCDVEWKLTGNIIGGRDTRRFGKKLPPHNKLAANNNYFFNFTLGSFHQC